MSAEFKIKINSLRTVTRDVSEVIVKRVDFSVVGTQEGQTFELPQSVELGEPNPESWIRFEKLNEEQVIAFVESAFANMAGVKAHIQYVLDKEVAKHRLEEAPLPWAPVPEPTPAVAPAEVS